MSTPAPTAASRISLIQVSVLFLGDKKKSSRATAIELSYLCWSDGVKVSLLAVLAEERFSVERPPPP